MGRTLQRTSVSTNIKERLDFSCALFASDGGLVANAPHIPVHLGSMQEAVKFQLQYLQGDINEGDVLVTNHPSAGGSHLPDITVVTPVFHEGVIVFFVASRGHHADIGGITPGSMPSNSTHINEEGAAIMSFKLVKNGQFQEAEITKILVADPAQFPGSSGARNVADNISDLKAQIAANNRGIHLVGDLITEYGINVVLAYMGFIRTNAGDTIQEFLRSRCKSLGPVLQAADSMDNGTKIQLCIRLNELEGSAVFDFTGTDPQVYGNLNAPRSITYSAVIYTLRCLVNVDIPLNQGCLAPISIILPDSSILSPDASAAVVGGNVLTSQRVVDVILKAFQACGASQGCMNNLTMGVTPTQHQSGWGYYETIAGGSGAGQNWHGTSGVHTHMTNTRITDPEIFEKRYPVILHEFSLRPGSGGNGAYRGGDGVVRRIEFLRPIDVSLLSERRVFYPYGMNGGSDGARGVNMLYRHQTRSTFNLGGKASFHVDKGDVLTINTPGGGGYGSPVK
jgi:5-oxoprolinase (ATP-hydrolysing)